MRKGKKIYVFARHHNDLSRNSHFQHRNVILATLYEPSDEVLK